VSRHNPLAIASQGHLPTRTALTLASEGNLKLATGDLSGGSAAQKKRKKIRGAPFAVTPEPVRVSVPDTAKEAREKIRLDIAKDKAKKEVILKEQIALLKEAKAELISGLRAQQVAEEEIAILVDDFIRRRTALIALLLK